jgi:serine phosphatase RsbU (regulator of sigma subunit)
MSQLLDAPRRLAADGVHASAPPREREIHPVSRRDLRPNAPVNILIVDDQPGNLLALEAVLERPEYRLVRADSGEQALNAVREEEFAVILLDVSMPGMDGFETAARIRGGHRSQYVPIVFITAIGMSETHVARGYSVGAVDYIFKPLVPDVLRSKVAAFVELFLKTLEVQHQERQLRELQRKEHEARLAEAQRRLEAERLRSEMEVARDIQQYLFPRKSPHCRQFDIAGASYPASSTGGDYFDFIPVTKSLLDIAVGDVSGHGVGPALLMSSTRAYIRMLSLMRKPVADVLTGANQALSNDIQGGKFVTLLLLRLNLDTRVITHASAGHGPGYVINATGDVELEMSSTGIPLGILSDAAFRVSPSFQLQPGNVVFLYTDGLVEARATDGSMFGVERALNIVRRHRRETANEILRRIYESVMVFTDKAEQRDDISAVVIKAVG